MLIQVISRNYLNVLTSQQLFHFFRVPLASFGGRQAAVLPNKLALYLKDLKLSSLAISASKLVASSFE